MTKKHWTSIYSVSYTHLDVYKRQIESMRTGKIMEWFPSHVKVRVYNERTGLKEDIIAVSYAHLDDEVYAPNYKNGETVALVRYPHGGTFEIPVPVSYTHLDVYKRQTWNRKRNGSTNYWTLSLLFVSCQIFILRNG